MGARPPPHRGSRRTPHPRQGRTVRPRDTTLDSNLSSSPPLYRVDWDRLHQELGVLSGGERRFLNLAISLGSPGHPVDLADNLSNLDDELLLLVLTATTHAAGRPRLLAPPSTWTTLAWAQMKN